MKENTYERSEEMEQLAREVIASDDRLAELGLCNIGFLYADFVKTATGGSSRTTWEDFRDIIQNEGVDWAVPDPLS